MNTTVLFGILAALGLAIAVYSIVQEEKAKTALKVARLAAAKATATQPAPALIPNPLTTKNYV